MPDKTCADCIHFIQHYRKSGKRYHILGSGHCATPRLRSRRVNSKPCPHFQERSPTA